MSGWLSRARDALSGRAAETVPEPIQLPCPCGRIIETVRRESFQRVLCKSCGEPFFILPLDVYPRPVVKQVRPAKTPKKGSSPTTATSTKSATSLKDSASNKSASAAEPTVTAPAIDIRKSAQQAVQIVRRQFTPLRIIALSLLTVLGLTGWWQWHRVARSHAELDYKAAIEAGLAALEQKDFVTAAKEYERATNSVNLLRRQDIAAEHTRQRSRELTALNTLLQSTLPEVIKAADQTIKKSDASAAEHQFAQLHVGRWVVLQGELVRSASTDGPPLAWEQRVETEDGVLLLTANLAAFSKVPVVPTASAAASATIPNETTTEPNNSAAINDDPGRREIVFAAQMQSLRWNADQKRWELTLNPTTGFLWSDFGLLTEAGIKPDELCSEAQWKSLLLEQSRWIGVAQ